MVTDPFNRPFPQCRPWHADIADASTEAWMKLTQEQRWHEGKKLFAVINEMMKAHIRAEHPNWTRNQVDDEWRRKAATEKPPLFYWTDLHRAYPDLLEDSVYEMLEQAESLK